MKFYIRKKNKLKKLHTEKKKDNLVHGTMFYGDLCSKDTRECTTSQQFFRDLFS